MRGHRIAIALAMLAGTSSIARAQPAEGTTEERQMTLPAGRVLVQAFAEINLSTDLAFKPISLAPDIWYGVSDVLTVGLIHSGRGATGFFGSVGDGLCLTGEENGCAKLYDNVGFDGRYHFYRSGGITMSADGGLFLGPFDPFVVALKLGAVGRWESSSLAVEFAPSIFLGLTERDPEGEVDVEISSNKETFFLPVTAMYSLSPTLGLAAQAGVVVPIEDAADLFTFAVSIGAAFMVSEKISVDAAFSLPALAGGELVEGGVDARTFTLGGSYAL